MKTKEFVFESKKPKTNISEPPKPRNFVAKNAMSTTSGAGVHRNQKRDLKMGKFKHKNQMLTQSMDVTEAEGKKTIPELETELDQYQAILKRSQEITKSIKYNRVHSEIITELKMLANQYKISPEMFDDAIGEVYDAASRLESAVYGLEEPIEDQIRNIKHMILELEDEEYYKESIEQESNCPECGGPLVSESALTEKKDSCYYKVKSKYKVWPSAYASGALVQCRKKGAKNWGNKSK